ncbi:hypothetical protein LAZ67_23001603 [Cordylochernes scorpioides]|uniref:Integrase catalytic domain-containing protein n=1 Tax=Cordylochernes scorpioides TaxID=51811 RepID=A0ABY6LSU0_9ARAC|nr:hypothetical protein LAZ67_23001603 [Cordylochernes scorpioides]
MEMEYEQSRREFFRHSLFGGSSTDVVEHEVYTIHLLTSIIPIARRISSGLVAIRTKLGWTVMGKIPPTEVRDDISSLCVTTLLSLDLENLWKLDAIGVSDAEVEKKTQSLQAEMEEHFAHTTTRDIEGRYEIALPWVQDKERIPSNKDLAENQLSSVRRKLEEVGDMNEYGQIFEEWMKQGIIEYAREDKLDGVHYLPHRPVYKRNSHTSRIRPVFNASARKRDKAPEHLKITAEQLKSSFYVDNCLSSFQNVEETEKFVKESTELLSTACFNLRDWDSYVEKTTLHIFCDASQFAYATCIFLRIEKEDRVDIQLIQARTRVAPLKKLTIPRLELLACLIGARLAANVIQDLEFEEIPRFYWTDSTNALCWIQREDNWAAFVMNGVKEIHNLSSPESWRHIPGRLNPADLPSRGCSAESLKETRWWEGPAWLKVSQEEWPKSTIIPDLEIVYSERRKTILNTLCTTRENENLFGRYSHFLRIVRITAWIYRFFNNAKIDRRKIISEDLSTEEITKSEIILIRLIQRESFSGHEDKKLQGFKLLVDSSGILRIKTKICRREDFANFRMPILLPSDHFLVSLLIRWNHETHGHAGLQTLLGILRENYWILRSRKTVKKIINQCIRCKRFTVTPATVESTSLPEDRVRDAAVFEIVGVDLTGHLILKNKKKAWIVIFTCAVYRGVHLELVTSLSMEAFLQAFRRFIARRGRPLIVYSDNGTNFKGMANALKKIDFSRLKCDPTLKNITWKFIPPGAPWWGGWWERLIGMMKQLLFRILGQTSLGYEELSTAMCDVESLMNTRPLTYLTEESEDLAPLTPSLFLHEVREVGVPDLDLIDNQTLSRKYQYIKRVREDLRERFRIEYFGFLRQETRRLKTTIPLKVGDMVLIGQESLKRLHWPLARIIQLYPGKDGLVRVAKVKTSSGDKIRPIQKLYNLEITPEIRCRDPLTERSPTQEVRLTTEEDPLTSQQEQHHIDTPNVVSSYGRPIKRPNRLDLLNFSFPCLSRRDANSKPPENVIFSDDDSDRREQQSDDTNFEAGASSEPPFLTQGDLSDLTVKVGSNEKLIAYGSGTITIETCVKGKWQTHYLTDVWYVPNFSRNVMSLQSTLDKGFEMEIDKKGCKLLKTTTGDYQEACMDCHHGDNGGTEPITFKHDKLIANHQRACGRISTNEKLRESMTIISDEKQKEALDTSNLGHCPFNSHKVLHQFAPVFVANKYGVPRLKIPPVKINTTSDKDGLPCRLYCDASSQGIAEILEQVHLDGKIHPKQYYIPQGYTKHEVDLLSRNPFCGFLSARTIKKHQPNLTDTSVAVDVNGLHTIWRKGSQRIQPFRYLTNGSPNLYSVLLERYGQINTKISKFLSYLPNHQKTQRSISGFSKYGPQDVSPCYSGSLDQIRLGIPIEIYQYLNVHPNPKKGTTTKVSKTHTFG